MLIVGDLTPMTPEQRVEYYKAVCKSLGLNMLTRPFEYILFKESENAPAKLQLYARKDCAEQLRKIHRVSVIPGSKKTVVDDDFATTELSVVNAQGRTDTATGVVYLWKRYNDKTYRLTGQNLGNAIMKSETKAKRRATLSICGLGILDEMDLESVRVVGGVTPEGRIYHLPEQGPEEPPLLEENVAHGHVPGSAKAKQAEDTLAKVEEEDRKLCEHSAASQTAKSGAEPRQQASAREAEAKPSPKYAIEIDLTNPEDPIVRGNTTEVFRVLENHITPTWGADAFWHVKPSDVATLYAASKQLNFVITEFPSQGKGAEVQGKAGAGTTARTEASAPKNQRKESKSLAMGASAPGKAADASPALLVKCTITRVISGMTGKNNPLRQVTVILADNKKPTYTCFDPKAFEYLDKGVGKEAEVYIQTRGKYTNLVGVKKIGGLEFEDGVPVIENSQRTGGTESLFK